MPTKIDGTYISVSAGTCLTFMARIIANPVGAVVPIIEAHIGPNSARLSGDQVLTDFLSYVCVKPLHEVLHSVSLPDRILRVVGTSSCHIS